MIWGWNEHLAKIPDHFPISNSEMALLYGGPDIFGSEQNCSDGGKGEKLSVGVGVGGGGFGGERMGNFVCKIIGLPTQARILKVSCGRNFTIFLSVDGEVWAWGQDSRGCLGNRNVRSVDSPILIQPKHFESARDGKV